jgi:hypothetical protein
VIAVAAGCGGSSSSSPPAVSTSAATLTPAKLRYQRQMLQLGNSLEAYISAVADFDQRAVSNEPSEQAAAILIARELTHLQARLRKAAGQLDAITPPADVRAAHQEMRQGVLEYASELNGVIGLVRSGNFNALESIATLGGVKAMERASTAITKKGYVIVSPS